MNTTPQASARCAQPCSAPPPFPTAASVLLEWQSLVSAIQVQLQTMADLWACGPRGADAVSMDLLAQLTQSMAAVSQLAPLLNSEFGRLCGIERVAAEAQAALVLARTALASTQVGERHARHQALHDALTELPNRRFFVERLERATALLKVDDRPQLALIYMDLDAFKPVNDVHGHEVGDELLKVLAKRLRCRVRGEDMVSRLGGDEFACLRQGHVSREELVQLAQKLGDTIAEPLQIGALCLRMRASIGIAVHPADGDTVQALMRNADLAMYAAKRRKSGYAFCAPPRVAPAQADAVSGSSRW